MQLVSLTRVDEPLAIVGSAIKELTETVTAPAQHSRSKSSLRRWGNRDCR